MNITIRTPAEVTGNIARELLKKAYWNNTSPASTPEVGLKHLSLYVGANLAGLLGTAAAARSVPPSVEAAERIYAQYQADRMAANKEAAATTTAPAPASSSPNRNSDDELSQLRELANRHARETLNAGKIGFLEAATGVGKSRLIGEAAAYCITRDLTAKVWVAAPSLTILAHLVKESERVSGFPSASASVILGKGQYLDPDLIDAGCAGLLRERSTTDHMRDQIHALTAWAKQGGEPLTPATSLFDNLLPTGVSYMLEDAKTLAPDLPLATWSLTAVDRRKKPSANDDTEGDDDSNETATKLAGDRQHADKARVVFTTHAYLATTLLLSRLRTPGSNHELPFTHLIVDEAHMLEEAVSSSLAAEYHAYGTTLWARRLPDSTPRRDAINEESARLRERLTAYCANLESGVIYESETVATIQQMFTGLHKLTRGKDLVATPVAHAIKAIMREGAPLYVQFTPIRKFPSIATGPGSVRGFLEKNLWSKLKGGLLYSATLYLLEKEGGAAHCHYQRVKLGVPSGRAAMFTPLTYRAIYSPTVHLPSLESAPLLTYPGGGAQAEDGATPATPAYKGWVAATAARTAAIANSAKGGTLMLCTSFADLRAVAAEVGSLLGPAEAVRLLAPSGEYTTTRNAEQFRRMRKDGLRPIWLATGAAWTGLDLRDEDAELAANDTLLTDLAILRLPLGLTRTTTQLARREWMGFATEINETCIKFKQGIGRLVRRPGLPDRRIHILDGRLVTLPRPHYRAYLRLLKPYLQRAELI